MKKWKTTAPSLRDSGENGLLTGKARGRERGNKKRKYRKKSVSFPLHEEKQGKKRKTLKNSI